MLQGMYIMFATSPNAFHYYASTKLNVQSTKWQLLFYWMNNDAKFACENKPNNSQGTFPWLDFIWLWKIKTTLLENFLRSEIYIAVAMYASAVGICFRKLAAGHRTRQCCGSGMFIPDPGSWFLSISDPGSRIQKQQLKRGVKNFFFFQTFFVATNCTKL